VTTGQARDPGSDSRVVAAAARQFAAYGYDGLTVAAVADEARTTRQAVCRRWPGKAKLAAAALGAFADLAAGTETADPYSDLLAELADFHQGVSRSGRMSLVGAMLQDGVDNSVRAR
jgi:AcrR family transcriptional regulator